MPRCDAQGALAGEMLMTNEKCMIAAATRTHEPANRYSVVCADHGSSVNHKTEAH